MSIRRSGIALAALLASSVSVFGQAGQVPAASTRRLSVDEAVKLAARAEPRDPDRTAESARFRTSPSRRRAARGSRRCCPASTGRRPLRRHQPVRRRPEQDHRLAVRNAVRRPAAAADRRRLQPDLEQLADLDEQLLPDLQPAAALEPRGQLHPAAAPQLQDRQHAAAGRDQPQGPREHRHDAPADDHADRRATSRMPTGTCRSRSTTSTRSGSRSISPSGCWPTTRSACRSARWRRSTSSRRSPKWRGTRSR